jgi:hypothetical protein
MKWMKREHGYEVANGNNSAYFRSEVTRHISMKFRITGVHQKLLWPFNFRYNGENTSKSKYSQHEVQFTQLPYDIQHNLLINYMQQRTATQPVKKFLEF